MMTVKNTKTNSKSNKKVRRRRYGKYARKARASSSSSSDGEAAEVKVEEMKVEEVVADTAAADTAAADTAAVDPWDDSEERSINTCCHSRRRFPDSSSKNLCIHHVTVTTSTGAELLNKATLRLHVGERYGMVGANGVGKTTLLRRIARHAIEGIPEHLRIFHMTQEMDGSDNSALREVMAADVERDALMAEEAELLDAEAEDEAAAVAQAARLTEVLERLEDIEAHTAEARARNILKGLGFSDKRMASPTSTLSGGWRMRVGIARALFLHPDVLMLDEPSNHLDLPAVLWLQTFLSMYDGCVVVVSHDTAFLDAVATHIIHFHNKQLAYYPGNYSAFRKARADKHLKNVHTQSSLDRQRAKWEAGIKKMEQQARSSKKDEKRGRQVAQRRKKLLKWGQQKTDDGKKWNCQKHSGMRPGSIVENAAGWKGRKMQRRSLIEAPPPKFTFVFPADIPVQGGGPLLQLREVSFSYPPATQAEATARAAAASSPVVATVGTAATTPGRSRRRGGRSRKAVVRKPAGPHLLNDVSLDISCRCRIGILGANGAGKSTLLKLLSGALKPAKGEVKRHRNLAVAMFTQHHVEQLALKLTPLQHMEAVYPSAKEQVLRSHLGSFGCGGALAMRPIGSLSGGQRSRVAFAQITFTSPHILIMDEPTNHLDFQAQEALQDAIKAFQGGVVIVSHSQSLIASTCNALYDVRGRTVTPFNAPFADWVHVQVEKAAARIAAQRDTTAALARAS